MLAQNFKSAADLRITEREVDALRKTLVLLETGRLTHVRDPLLGGRASSFTGHFNMSNWAWKSPCGSICCIGGTAEFVGGLSRDSLDRASHHNERLHELFYPHKANCRRWGDITTAQAATALRSYLTTGSANWDLAVA